MPRHQIQVCFEWYRRPDLRTPVQRVYERIEAPTMLELIRLSEGHALRTWPNSTGADVCYLSVHHEGASVWLQMPVYKDAKEHKRSRLEAVVNAN